VSDDVFTLDELDHFTVAQLNDLIDEANRLLLSRAGISAGALRVEDRGNGILAIYEGERLLLLLSRWQYEAMKAALLPGQPQP